MKTQSTTSSSSNPYATVLFTPSSVANQVQQIIDMTLEEFQENNAKKSKKNYECTLSNYISSFLKIAEYNDDETDKNQTDEQKGQISSFSSILRFDDHANSSQRSVKLNVLNPINPAQVLIRPASAPPIQRELPLGPDPSHIIKPPPERYLLPPFLWGKTTKQASTSSDYEDVQQAPPPPVHRRRGRPRKNPLPDDLYANNHHSNSNLVKYHSAQINIHSSSSATFYNNGSSTTASNKSSSKKNKTIETSTFSESSPKEPVESTNIKTEKNSNTIIENTEDNSTSSTNTTPIRNSSSENSIKNNQPQKFKARDSASSSDTNNESESDVEPDEVVTISEDRPPKPPETVFPESDIDEICASKNKNSEYLVKFKGKAYKDAEWIQKEKLMKTQEYVPAVLSFEHYGINTQEPYFNPLFLIPEKILDIDDKLYLIKWAGLPYKQSTWEVLDDLNITKTNLNNLTEKFESMKNRPKNDQDLNITYSPININDQFSLDEIQNGVVDRLYKKFCSGSDTNLYGTIGSILRLEISALLSVLKSRHSLHGPSLLVVASPVLKLASCEIATYTNLAVLTIPDDDAEEMYYIQKNAFVFSDNETPKFDVVVVSSTNFQKFTTEFPQLNYLVAAVDTSEIAEQPLPNIHSVKASMRITVKKRTGKEEPMDSQDDSTFLHSEFTIFSPMLKSQRLLYQQTIRDNIDILTTPVNKIDKSRLYEAVTKLCSLANSPACLNSQEVVFKMANPTMKKKRFEDSGKMRVLRELINFAQNNNKRLMVMCRDSVVLDTLQLYVTAYEIPYVHVGMLGLKRRKLDDFSPEAKVNKNIIVLAQFGKQAINWLPLMLDIIVVFDGVYNPMYYFSHAARKPRKRDCIIVRLLAEESHEAYLASCADHYEDLPMYDIFKAAAETFMRPAREAVITGSHFLKNTRYDVLFNSSPTSFQYIFDEEKSAKISAQDSKKNIELEGCEVMSSQKKKSALKSISSSSSTTNFLDKMNITVQQPSTKTAFFPPLPKSTKKVTESQETADDSITLKELVKRPEISASKSVPDLVPKDNSIFPTSTQKTIITKLDSKSQKSDNSDISADEIEDTDEASAPPKPSPAQVALSNLNGLQSKKPKTVQISPSHQIQENLSKSSKTVESSAIQATTHLENVGITSSPSASAIDKKYSSSLIKNAASEPNLYQLQQSQNSKRKRVFKRKIRLEPGQPLPPKPEHGTITIHHHHRRISSSFSSTTTIQQIDHKGDLKPLSKISSTPPLKAALASLSGDFFYKLVESPRNVAAMKDQASDSQQWTINDLSLLLFLISNHPWGQWDLVHRAMQQRFSIVNIRETSFKVIKFLLDKDRGRGLFDFPILRRVVSDHSSAAGGSEASDLLIDDFLNAKMVGEKSLHYRLTKLSLMLVVSIVMAASVKPPGDIVVAQPNAKTVPAPWWTMDDDRELIYFVWQNGYSLFACQPNIWSQKTVVHSNKLIVRFESLMKEAEIAIVSKSSIVFPHTLQEHMFTLFSHEEVESALNSPTGQVVNDFGFIENDQIAKLLGQSIDHMVNNSIQLTQCASVYLIADFFERVHYELLAPEFYYAEDYQLMEAVEFHGRSHSGHSLLVQAVFGFQGNSAVYDFINIINTVKKIFENRRNDPVTHVNTSFNSIGNNVPAMPFILSDRLQITNLGEISNKSGFHNEKYVYPVGYEAITVFSSVSDPNTSDKYLCQIIDSGTENPIFKVTSLSKEIVFQDDSPDKVWKQISDKVSYINSIHMFESVKTPGHELFGLTFPTTIRLIQSLRGCDQCMKYRIRAFKVPFENIKH